VIPDGVMADPTCGGKIFAAHENNCHKYYLCQFGVLTEQTCPAGLHWNKVNPDIILNKMSLVTVIE
jgi:chitinase